MSMSSFLKAYEEIANLGPMEMTFIIEDADLDKLNDVLKDINVRECPWFEIRDKHGNKAKYYREPQWIPCSERLPEEGVDVLFMFLKNMAVGSFEDGVWYVNSGGGWYTSCGEGDELPVAWMPFPSSYREEADE